jgi:hypothetical protein
MTNTTTKQPVATLNAMDRCDRCGAQAYLRVELTSGGQLLFCAHHAAQHREKLTQVAAHIHDETARLSS